jgi:hypothetical protein
MTNIRPTSPRPAASEVGEDFIRSHPGTAGAGYAQVPSLAADPDNPEATTVDLAAGAPAVDGPLRVESGQICLVKGRPHLLREQTSEGWFADARHLFEHRRLVGDRALLGGMRTNGVTAGARLPDIAI